MYYEQNRTMKKNDYRKNDRIYYDDCNVLYKICGVITFVWGIMTVFGVVATIIGAGGPDAVSQQIGAYTYIIFAGISMVLCGLYAYRMRYTDVSILGFLLAVVSASLSLIMIGVLVRYIPPFFAMAIVPSATSVLIAYEHSRHAR